MHIFTKVVTYREHRQRFPERSISFVPTMGALHSGHLALIRQAQTYADETIVSIFVNPIQFNDRSDYDKYPRPLLEDISRLEGAGGPTLFAPTLEEMYPADLDLSIGDQLSLTHLTQPLEGAHRPGHFEGVVKVVHRLLDIVKPEVLVMGQKDFQQLAIIREMIKQLDLPIKLIGHPIVREKDGLALSSRNVRLDPQLRPLAPTIYEVLQYAQGMKGKVSPRILAGECTLRLVEAGFKVEYFSIVSAQSLQTITDWSDDDPTVACVAAWLGDVRLIDNQPL